MECRLQIHEHPHVARATHTGPGFRRRLCLRPATAPAAPHTIERRHLGAVVSVALTGELDLAAAARADLELREAGAQAEFVVWDLRDLTFVDCAGLWALRAAGSLVRAIGREFTLDDSAARRELLYVGATSREAGRQMYLDAAQVKTSLPAAPMHLARGS